MNKPWIGLTPSVDRENGRLWLNPDYLNSIRRAGAMPVMLPLTADDGELDAMVEKLDGFLFTGGPDLDPKWYGQERMDVCGEVDAGRDAMEMTLIRKAMAAGKPILGICRGFQLINAALGGTLWQDIPSQLTSEVTHRVVERPLARDTHTVTVSEECPFGELGKILWVNSRHHQGVRELAPGLKCRAVSADGLVEAFYLPGEQFVRAVQWHPENFENDLSCCIFREFVSMARKDI